MSCVLTRLDADVVGINEVDSGQLERLEQLGAEHGYTVLVPESNPFGYLRNAILTRLEVESWGLPTSATLSGDARANDLTRLPVQATLSLPGGGAVTVLVQHWKSGSGEDDIFRRMIDGVRTAQAAAEVDGLLAVVMGDVNDQLEDAPGWPGVFRDSPDGLPGAYTLGDDLRLRLEDGLANDPFAVLAREGFSPADARQRDGSQATRWESGRHIDYVFTTAAVAGADLFAEVYDSDDEGISGLASGGAACPRATSESASDHLPVLIRFAP